MDFKSLQNKIEFVLERFAYTRNNDINLTIKVWELFYPNLIKKLPESLHYLPRESDVKRLRAIIQNKRGEYPPTSLNVAYKRKQSVKQWRERVKVA